MLLLCILNGLGGILNWVALRLAFSSPGIEGAGCLIAVSSCREPSRQRHIITTVTSVQEEKRAWAVCAPQSADIYFYGSAVAWRTTVKGVRWSGLT